MRSGRGCGPSGGKDSRVPPHAQVGRLAMVGFAVDGEQAERDGAEERRPRRGGPTREWDHASTAASTIVSPKSPCARYRKTVKPDGGPTSAASTRGRQRDENEPHGVAQRAAQPCSTRDRTPRVPAPAHPDAGGAVERMEDQRTQDESFLHAGPRSARLVPGHLGPVPVFKQAWIVSDRPLARGLRTAAGAWQPRLARSRPARDRGLRALPAPARLVPRGGARQGPALRGPGATGASRCPASATRGRAC